MLLVESGNRIGTTEFDWPKNLMPSGFSMKVQNLQDSIGWLKSKTQFFKVGENYPWDKSLSIG